MSPTLLSQKVVDFVTCRTEAAIARFFPDFLIPEFFCGIRRPASEAPDLIFVLGHLHTLGVTTICGLPIGQAIAKLLRQVNGPATNTFFSYRVAETLLTFGKFDGNPLLEGFNDAERENIRVATDSTQIFDPATKSLRNSLANNFWGVLARCEVARQRIGLLEDDSVLNHCIGHLNELLFCNPLGFLDDTREGIGRYDIYSADTHLFCEPVWHLLKTGKLEPNLLKHVRLAEKIAMENGAAFVYGRSIGALSICLLIELLSMSLERGLASDPARSLRLATHAFEEFTGWIEDDLINAHRHGTTDHYRGINRLLQMTFDCLGKLCYAAVKLRGAQPIADAPQETTLFGHIDEFIPFDTRTAGIWMFRNEHLAFQFPLVDNGGCPDYLPWPRSPGLLENPVSAPLLCGVPRIAKGMLEYAVFGLPEKVEKSAGAMAIMHEDFKCVSDQTAPPLRGRRTANYRVDGDTIHWEEHLVFETTPDALSFCIPETGRPLRLTITSAQPFHHDTLTVSGMPEWRSCWGGLEKVHQIHFTASREIRFSLEITPMVRVRPIPKTNHEYTSALLGAMPRGCLVEKPWQPDAGMDVAAMTAGADILHVSWPEHIFGSPTWDLENFDARYLKFISDLGRSNVRVAWTMHNRRPHRWDATRGRRLYEAWAAIADGVIHHSHWGMNLMRSELPYRDDAKHVVIPHGHFGAQRQPTQRRAQIEASLGLKPCAMRFGVTGGWGKAKQVEMIMSAFSKAAHPGQQLVVTAYTPQTVKPDDPRIVLLPRADWMTPEQMADYTHLCDALVSAHNGESYLTSGLSADAIGEGIPIFAPHWEFFHETLGDAPFYHDNTEESLAASFASLTLDDLQRGKAAFKALQAQYAWPILAERTLGLFRSLGNPLNKSHSL